MGAMFVVALHFLGRPTFLCASLIAADIFMTLISQLANLLILPTRAGVMLLGRLAAFKADDRTDAGATWLLQTNSIRLVRFCADLPFSSISLSIREVGMLAYLIQEYCKRLRKLGHRFCKPMNWAVSN